VATLVLGEWSGLLSRQSVIGGVAATDLVDARVVATILFVYGLLTVVTGVLGTGIVKLLRMNEHELRIARGQSQALANLRRSFLHLVLHDVRSPVGTAISMLDGVCGGIDGPLTDFQWRRIARVGQRLRDVLDLLRSLRVLADLETERLDALMAPVDLGDVVRAVVEEHGDAAEQRNLRLRIDLPASLPAIRGIARLLHEALANYVGNAIKYTPTGGSVVVSARHGRGGVRVEVTDDGPGIPLDQQSLLFREFSRVGDSTRGRGKIPGVGLGLSIVRRIAEVHGGRAGVVSEPGCGSSFFLEFRNLDASKQTQLVRSQ
jgi:signal transduction histidine kinase